MTTINVEALVVKLQEWLVDFAIQAIAAIIILFVGLQIAKFLRNLVEKLMQKSRVDSTLITFASNATYMTILVLVGIVFLGQIGVKTASLIAILGSAGIAIGLALQGSLSNLAAGVMLIIFRPFRIGDYIEGAGIAGIVKEIQMFSTILNTPDNRRVIAPNSKLFGDSIINYSAENTRRIDLVFGVGYGDDIHKVKKIIGDILDQDERILQDPAPTIGLLELADSSVNFAVRPWVKAADYWDVYFSLQERIKERFDSEGINIPFPQRDLHVYQN